MPNDHGTPIPDILLAWYDRHRRVLPWRALAGARPDPYHVWLSEVMLQQTTVAAVKDYFNAFTARWPTVQDLAAADLDDVLHAWAGLGYYARARNLLKCARVVSETHGGIFPDCEEELRRLPGIGVYTAAAIAAIAFDRPASPVDGNIERVVARLFAIETPLPAAKPDIREKAATLTPPDRPGDFAQAMMDLGAGVCLPRQPRCLACPLTDRCAAHAAGIAGTLPKKVKKAQKPVRRAVVFWLTDQAGRVLIRRRPETGLLGGMMEFPSTPWIEAEAHPDPDPVSAGVMDARVTRSLDGVVRHTFTHFHLDLRIAVGRLDRPADRPTGDILALPDALGDHALPTAMTKVARQVLRSIG